VKKNGVFAELARSQFLAPKLEGPSETVRVPAKAARKATPRKTKLKKV
jgi:hypothetical protein